MSLLRSRGGNHHDLKAFKRELWPHPLQFPRDDGNAVVTERELDTIDLLTGVSPWKSRMLSKNNWRRTLPSSSCDHLQIFGYWQESNIGFTHVRNLRQRKILAEIDRDAEGVLVASSGWKLVPANMCRADACARNPSRMAHKFLSSAQVPVVA